MFGRSPEFVPPIELSEIEEQNLLDAAVARIETIDGVDFLDSFPLPPDNEEVWKAQTFTVRTTRITQIGGDGTRPEDYEVTSIQEKVESTLSNSFVRQANLRCLSRGLPPLFMTWDEIDEYGHLFWQPKEPKPTLGDRFRNWIGLMAVEGEEKVSEQANS